MGFAARPDPTCDLSGKIVEPIQQICPTGTAQARLCPPCDLHGFNTGRDANSGRDATAPWHLLRVI
jgi:hypothetical protein